MTAQDSCVISDLTAAQKAFLAYCKEFGWGKLEVTVKKGEPVMANVVVEGGVVRQDTKFD